MRTKLGAAIMAVLLVSGAEASGGEAAAATATAEDPYLWLEDVAGEKPLAWVRERNRETAQELEKAPGFESLRTDILAILDSDAKIPYISKAGDRYYNFWRDAKHVRGLWRRTTLEEYRKAEPRWEVVLDLDALSLAEKESWVFHGAQFLRPECRRCLIRLSRGGADASVVREFDVGAKSFVEGGFELPEAKSAVGWIDLDTIFVGTDFGAGSMTTSGYPRIAKRWRRGTPLSQAKVVYEGRMTDVDVGAYHDPAKGFERDFVVRTPSFFTQESFVLGKDGAAVKIDVPDDAKTTVHREWLLVEPRTPWTVKDTTYAAGSLVAARFDDYVTGKRDLRVLFAPSPTTSIDAYAWTRDLLVLNVLDDVKNRLTVFTPGSGEWRSQPLAGPPPLGSVEIDAVDDEESNDVFMTAADFLTPTSLHLLTAGRPPEKLKQMPAFFDASGLEVAQHFTTSKDGTRVPYFQVSPKGWRPGGSQPTLLTGYGGFEVSELPHYSGGVGRGWLSRGGVYVVANIRGGGEYGPRWHQAALKRNRLRAYEDFAAVAEDLIARKVTTPKRLGILGGSNGGLLVGNMLTLYPQLFGAIVCQVPLLDMKRYTHLLAGASWMEEYGDPDNPDEWAFVRTFSPYHNLRAGAAYPPVLFMTSTRDDRVHPGHARKMTARMRALGFDVRYYENIEGGHGGAADNKQAAHMWALAYTFLYQRTAGR